MKSHGTKSEVAAMVAAYRATLAGMPVHGSGWRPVVYVGQVSARRFMVGTRYQAGPAVGDLMKGDASDFLARPVIVAVG